METYLVGGAVRDELLGRPVTERDWVVVGATADDMLALGYRSVGRDFPVFLHPKTKEEYALARTERKTGPGHRGFECSTEAVTLEEDLARRDLTINAIARLPDGTLVDPWGGLEDINGRRLRYVSPAFREDPLRVLRVARFAAKLANQGFSIHADTMDLMREMVAEGELVDLTPERVLGEMDKALSTESPARFFEVLHELGADQILWPELATTNLQTLSKVAPLSESLQDRTAGLLQGLPANAIDTLAARIRLPRKRHEFARLASTFANEWSAADTMNAAAMVEFFARTDAFRQPDRLGALNDYWRIALPGDFDSTNQLVAACFQAACSVNAASVSEGLTGPAVGAAIRAEQVCRVADVLREQGAVQG